MAISQDVVDAIDRRINHERREMAATSASIGSVVEYRARQLMDAAALLYDTYAFTATVARAQEQERAAAEQRRWIYQRDREAL